MKINKLLLITLLCFSYITLSICSDALESPEISKYNFFNNILLGPRIAHITNNYQKVIKPLIERPFLPQEVDNLMDAHNKDKKNFQYSMETAQIVGNPAPRSKGEEVSNY